MTWQGNELCHPHLSKGSNKRTFGMCDIPLLDWEKMVMMETISPFLQMLFLSSLSFPLTKAFTTS